MKFKLIVNDLLNKLKTMLMLDRGPKICEIAHWIGNDVSKNLLYRILLDNKNSKSW